MVTRSRHAVVYGSNTTHPSARTHESHTQSSSNLTKLKVIVPDPMMHQAPQMTHQHTHALSLSDHAHTGHPNSAGDDRRPAAAHHGGGCSRQALERKSDAISQRYIRLDLRACMRVSACSHLCAHTHTYTHIYTQRYLARTQNGFGNRMPRPRSSV